MSCLYDDVSDILYMDSSKPEIRYIIERLQRSIADNSLRNSLTIDDRPLTYEQYSILTANFINDMNWDRVLLLFKIGLFVTPDERDEVARDISDTYCDWITNHGGLCRLVSRNFWSCNRDL